MYLYLKECNQDINYVLKEKGMSILRTQRRGDMIVRVHAETPVNLSADQEKLLNQFNDSLTKKKNSTMTEGFLTK